MCNHCIESGHLSIEDCCIKMHDRLFMVLHSSVCWMVSWCYNGLLTVIVSWSMLIVQDYYTGTLDGLFTCRITQDCGGQDLSDRVLQF